MWNVSLDIIWDFQIICLPVRSKGVGRSVREFCLSATFNPTLFGRAGPVLCVLAGQGDRLRLGDRRYPRMLIDTIFLYALTQVLLILAKLSFPARACASAGRSIPRVFILFFRQTSIRGGSISRAWGGDLHGRASWVAWQVIVGSALRASSPTRWFVYRGIHTIKNTCCVGGQICCVAGILMSWCVFCDTGWVGHA